MDARIPVLKTAFDITQMVFGAVVGDMEQAQAEFRAEGATVPCGAAIMAHALFGIDMVLNQHVRGRELVLSAPGLCVALLSPFAGWLADNIGRKRVLVLGWVIGLAVPLMVLYATSWTWVVVGADGKPRAERAGHYEDTLVREDGQWKFKSRQAFTEINP